MSAPSKTTSLSRLTLSEWQDYVESHPESTTFHHRAWIELLMEQYGFALHLFGVKQAGQITAAVPFLETKKPWGTKKLISLPFTDYMRVLADDENSLRRLLDGLRDEPFERYRAVVLRTDRPLGLTAETGHWLRHEIPINLPFETITSRFSSSTRANIQKAKKRGLRFVQSSDADAMAAFYRLHLATRIKHGVPIQPKRFFTRFHERIIRPGLCYIALVTKNDHPISTAVNLTFNKTVIFKYLASDPRALSDRPNELLDSSVIRLANEQGYETIDFGRSDSRNEGLSHYKRKWGAIENELSYEYLIGQPSPPPADEPLSERIASSVIRRSPAFVCRSLGEVLYKYSQ